MSLIIIFITSRLFNLFFLKEQNDIALVFFRNLFEFQGKFIPSSSNMSYIYDFASQEHDRGRQIESIKYIYLVSLLCIDMGCDTNACGTQIDSAEGDFLVLINRIDALPIDFHFLFKQAKDFGDRGMILA